MIYNLITISTIVSASFDVIGTVAITIANPKCIFYFALRIIVIEPEAIAGIISTSFDIIRVRVTAVTIVANPIWTRCAVRILVSEIEAISTIISASFGITRISVSTFTIANPKWIWCFAFRISCIELVAISTVVSASFRINGIKVIACTISNHTIWIRICAVRIVFIEPETSVINDEAFDDLSLYPFSEDGLSFRRRIARLLEMFCCPWSVVVLSLPVTYLFCLLILFR